MSSPKYRPTTAHDAFLYSVILNMCLMRLVSRESNTRIIRYAKKVASKTNHRVVKNAMKKVIRNGNPAGSILRTLDTIHHDYAKIQEKGHQPECHNFQPSVISHKRMATNGQIS